MLFRSAGFHHVIDDGSAHRQMAALERIAMANRFWHERPVGLFAKQHEPTVGLREQNQQALVYQ